MRSLDGQIFLSASDLMRFTGCSHATTLNLAYLQERDLTPREDSEDALLLQKSAPNRSCSRDISASGNGGHKIDSMFAAR